MAKRVLVPVDESDRSNDAFEYALDEYGDEEIIALHVINPQHFYAATGIEGGVTTSAAQLQENLEQRASSMLESKQQEAEHKGVSIDTDHVIGGVANSIVAYTEEHDIDHIVMGSHGRSGTSRVLLGSVAETVTRRSPVSVTIVR